MDRAFFEAAEAFELSEGEGSVGVTVRARAACRGVWTLYLPSSMHPLLLLAVCTPQLQGGLPSPPNLHTRHPIPIPSRQPTQVPVRILHGACDDVVPLQVGERLVRQLAGRDVTLTAVKDGDHRLSTLRDIELLEGAVAQLHRQLLRAGGS